MLIMPFTVMTLLVAFVTSEGQPAPRIGRESLLGRGAVFFSDRDVDSYNTLMVDTIRGPFDTIVGARDYLLRFNHNLKLLEKIELPPTEDQQKECVHDHPQKDCHNFIKVLYAEFNSITACGTSAFSPTCHVRDADRISWGTGSMKGEHLCPSNPSEPVAWFHDNFNQESRLFLGAVLDVEKDPSGGIRIMANTVNGDKTIVTKLNHQWLYKAEIVGTFKSQEFVYFVFKERRFDSSTGGEMSRIARVCLNDAGEHSMSRDHWSSFTKAKFECGKYDVVQEVTYVERTRMLYATFEVGKDKKAGSAVCQFTEESMTAAFGGDFLCWKGPAWEPCKPSPLGKDSVETCFGGRALADVTTHVFMETPVKPECEGPVYETPLHVKWIGATEDGSEGTIAYVSIVEDANIMVLGPMVCGAVKPLEIWEISFANRTINIMAVKHTVLVLTKKEVISIPLLSSIPTTPTTPTIETSAVTVSGTDTTIQTSPDPSNQACSFSSWITLAVLTIKGILELT